MSDDQALLRAHARYLEADADVSRLLLAVEQLQAQIANSLDAAWAEAEAALPDGWDLSVGSHRIGAGYFAVATHPVDDLDVTSGEDERHATPAAALRALAVKLREALG